MLLCDIASLSRLSITIGSLAGFLRLSKPTIRYEAACGRPDYSIVTTMRSKSPRDPVVGRFEIQPRINANERESEED